MGLIHRQNNREFIRSLKSQPCVDCSVPYPYWIMTFDHIAERGAKLYDLSSSKMHRQSRQTILDEAAKCDVVCANCHANRTFRRKADNAGDCSN